MPTIASTLRHHSLRMLLIFLFGWSLEGRCLAGESAHWPQWRGQDGEGISLEKDLPGEWTPDKNIQWKVSIAGRGHSSPVVWGNRIFVTTAVEGEQLPKPTAVKHMIDKEEFKHPDWVGSDRRYTMKVLCLDGDSGKILWEAIPYEGTVFDHRHRKSSYASPTPVTDGENVYVYFGSEGVDAYSFNGDLIWKSNLGGIRTIGMGVGTSPVLFENLLIVQVDEDEGENSFLVALNKNDGHEVWRTPRKVQVSWSTPLIVNTEKRMELITSGSESIVSYNPATGEEYWYCKGLASNAIPSPVAGKDIVVLSAGFPEKRVKAIRLGGSGDLTGTANILWEYNKGTAYVASPIVYGDYIYLLSDKGILTCLELKTGRVMYDNGRVPVPATFMSSPVAFDDKILVTSEEGDTFVVRAGTSHQILQTNSVGEPVFASLALAASKIFIRGEKNLYCIGKTPATP